jgi:hypothetical protein
MAGYTLLFTPPLLILLRSGSRYCSYRAWVCIDRSFDYRFPMKLVREKRKSRTCVRPIHLALSPDDLHTLRQTAANSHGQMRSHQKKRPLVHGAAVDCYYLITSGTYKRCVTCYTLRSQTGSRARKRRMPAPLGGRPSDVQSRFRCLLQICDRYSGCDRIWGSCCWRPQCEFGVP